VTGRTSCGNWQYTYYLDQRSLSGSVRQSHCSINKSSTCNICRFYLCYVPDVLVYVVNTSVGEGRLFYRWKPVGDVFVSRSVNSYINIVFDGACISQIEKILLCLSVRIARRQVCKRLTWIVEPVIPVRFAEPV
jgi:hypothetical protein